MLEFFSSISPMKTTAIRHSNIYGPHDKFDLERSHVFGATITKAMTAENDLVVWGTGEEERDLLHVSDLVSFVEAAIAHQPDGYRLYNCGGGGKISIKNLVKEVVKATGKNLSIKHDLSQPSIPTSLFLDNSLATDELGWHPQVKLEDGIAQTISWWRENIDPSTLQPFKR
jgi:nucleoside-diphosphate-sugar epimerase